MPPIGPGNQGGGSGFIADAFSVNRNGVNQLAIPSGILTVVEHNVVLFDTLSGYDTGTFRFTPTRAGYWHFSAGVTFVNGVDNARLTSRVTKNLVMPVAQSVARFNGTGSGIQSTDIDCVINMNGTTDFVQHICYQETAVDQDINGGAFQTFFSGFYVGSF